MANRSQIDRAREMILGYLSLHPNASDTSEGIRQWWLAGEGIGSVAVDAALRELVLVGQIRERISPDGGAHYSLPGVPRVDRDPSQNRNNGRH
jgi:hypothetical protein